jgi:GNAT superfamily N-acetyltransferase
MGIRRLTKSDLPLAMKLVREVFLEFEAPDYGEEGVREFGDYIALPAMEKRVEEGTLFLWGSFDGERLAGVIASRQPCHISLLFVDKAYHRRGIARALVGAMLDWHREQFDFNCVTVNASPYAAKAYHHLGFRDTAPEQTVNGLRFIPMVMARE